MPAKGQKGVRHGGRQKGTLNKDAQELLDMIRATGAKHPVEGLARVAVKASKFKDYDLEHKCYKELAQYVLPKRRSVDVTSGGEQLQEVTRITRVIVDTSDD